MAKKDEFDLNALHADLTTKTDVQIKEQLSALQREANELDLEIKREQVAKIRSERASKLSQVQQRNNATKSFLAQREAQQNRCNHRKGGRGAGDVIEGKGNAAEYAVIKHRLPHGAYFVLCLRCSKEWHPDTTRIGGTPETPGYAEALNFPTDNTASGSSTFNFAHTSAA